ncbi:MAG: 50S ribosomal protein L25 [Thermomicrobiales bacterium]
MSTPSLMAEPRDVVGKKVKRLRAMGKVPAVVYGPALEQTVQITVNERDFIRFYHHHGHATLFDLDCDGSTYQVFIRDVQASPVRRNPIHIDFFAPNLNKPIHASVPIALHDAPDGPGIFSQLLSEIVVNGLPRDIPHRVVVDASVLQAIGDAVRVSDVEFAESIELVTNADEIIAMLVAPVLETDVTEEEGAEEGEVAPDSATIADDGGEAEASSEE